MTVKDAVADRFRQICKERNIKPNELANRAGVTPSSVYSMLDPKRREVSVNLVKKLCDGLDMTLGAFLVLLSLMNWSRRFVNEVLIKRSRPSKRVIKIHAF